MTDQEQESLCSCLSKAQLWKLILMFLSARKKYQSIFRGRRTLVESRIVNQPRITLRRKKNIEMLITLNGSSATVQKESNGTSDMTSNSNIQTKC